MLPIIGKLTPINELGMYAQSHELSIAILLIWSQLCRPQPGVSDHALQEMHPGENNPPAVYRQAGSPGNGRADELLT